MYIGEVKLDSRDIVNLKCKIDEYGSVHNLMDRLLFELDASYTMPDGGRPRQTISYVWKRTFAETEWLLKYMSDTGVDNDIIDDYYNKRGVVIQKSIDYEKENPPIDYDLVKKKSKVNTKSKKAITKDMFDGTVSEMTKTGKLKKIKKTTAEIRQERFKDATVQVSFGSINFKKKE